ncbi:FMN-binding protein [Oscillospiraceae bacterium MB08-C2-2]|nr:FMN-binding protein [Oscillospiraceae bacterium MB08-C2-2]
MKRIKVFVCLLLLVQAILLPGCSLTSYRDGVYTAQAAEFSSSGWKETLELTIKHGKIAKINWDAIYKDDSIPIRKKQYSKSGLYGMLAGGANNEWYDQAVAAEQFIIENGPGALALTDDGHTDAVAGCSISVSELDRLLADCLKQAQK